MRHEQATAYAADAYARMTGEAGVCMVTAGCGLTNAVTGLCLAAMTNSAVVCVSGQHPNTEDHQGSFQEAYGSDVLRSFAKYTKRVTDWSTIEFDMRLAFREALTPPQGVSLSKSRRTSFMHRERTIARRWPALHVPKMCAPPETRRKSTARIETFARRPAAAHRGRRRPLLVAGRSRTEGVRRTDLHPGLRPPRRPGLGFRRASAGDPWRLQKAVHGPCRCDLDARLPLLERRAFRPPADMDRQGQVHPGRPDPDRIGWQVPAEIPIVGDPKLVLRQLITRIKELKLDFSKNRTSNWVKELGEVRANFERQVVENEKKFHTNRPIHPARLTKDLVTVLDKNATVVIDSFTLSGWMCRASPRAFPARSSTRARSRRSAMASVWVSVSSWRVLATGGLEHGRRRTGHRRLRFGNRGPLQPADRVCAVEQQFVGSRASSRCRYSRIAPIPSTFCRTFATIKYFPEMGCHGEHSKSPMTSFPRSSGLKSGKPALVNVIGDKTVGHPTFGGNLLGSTGSN